MNAVVIATPSNFNFCMAVSKPVLPSCKAVILERAHASHLLPFGTTRLGLSAVSMHKAAASEKLNSG